MAYLVAPNTGFDEIEFLETSQDAMRARFGIQTFDFPTPSSGIRHIGYAPKTQTWYGWSHRAVTGFKVGSTVKPGDVIAQGTAANLRPDAPGPFPVGFTAKTLDDARRMAAQFAIEVS